MSILCSTQDLPFLVEYIPLKKQIEEVNGKYGEKKDLLLLDNNVLASPKFNQIIDEIKESGFHEGVKLNSCLECRFQSGNRSSTY